MEELPESVGLASQSTSTFQVTVEGGLHLWGQDGIENQEEREPVQPEEKENKKRAATVDSHQSGDSNRVALSLREMSLDQDHLQELLNEMYNNGEVVGERKETNDVDVDEIKRPDECRDGPVAPAEHSSECQPSSPVPSSASAMLSGASFSSSADRDFEVCRLNGIVHGWLKLNVHESSIETSKARRLVSLVEREAKMSRQLLLFFLYQSTGIVDIFMELIETAIYGGYKMARLQGRLWWTPQYDRCLEENELPERLPWIREHMFLGDDPDYLNKRRLWLSEARHAFFN